MEKLLMSFFVAVMLSWIIDIAQLINRTEIAKIKANATVAKFNWEMKELKEEIQKSEEYWKHIKVKN